MHNCVCACVCHTSLWLVSVSAVVWSLLSWQVIDTVLVCVCVCGTHCCGLCQCQLSSGHSAELTGDWHTSHDHITPALRDVLHWLPVSQSTEFKIAVLAFDCVRGTGPAYFKDVCVPVLDIAARSSLRSAERGDLFVPRTRTMKLSRRSFTVAAPVVWNSLPAHLWSVLISRGQFRAGLKTHLFKQAYSLWEHFVLRM